MSAKLSILATPKASRSEVVGWQEGALKVRIAAPPVDGKANAELLKFLAKYLGVAKRDVALVSGEGSRRKVVEIAGVTEAELFVKLPTEQ
ncbi:DUF167 domain-containing protein [Cerasicoccus fimbriatus]|uniref:DUF167 domain-containing protein n=1 Tax=Cerasicoccus fimbriatus TaxID=3014554 RepID=UPI0022B565CB|nr:DUF167 domain-containing protein [Cerasicoccus sp. TK19100]